MCNSSSVLALRSGAICAVLAVLPQAAFAQSNDRPLIYTNKTVFHLPVRIDDRHRAGLREIRLYVKSGPADWVRQETGKPDVKTFSYRVPQDGEYWFSVATVDLGGQVSPSDITREPPGLRVLVDTNPPIIDLKSATGADGKPCIKCTMQDANPDMASLKVSYRTVDGRDQVLAQDAAASGSFAVTSPEVWGRAIQVEAKDRCGNVTQREFQLQSPVAQVVPPPQPLTANTTPTQPATGNTPPLPNQLEPVNMKNDLPLVSGPDFSPPTTAPAPTTPPNLTIPPTNTTVHEVQSIPSQPPQTISSLPAPQTPAQPKPPQQVSSLPPENLPPQQIQSAPLPSNNLPPESGITPVSHTQAPPTFNAPRSTRLGDSRRLLNTTRAILDYRIDDVGPSGVSKVEVWMTGDDGRTWRRLHEDFDRISPADLTLPGEGIFGIRLAVTNGNGFGGTPPKNGDEPTSLIEVDTSSPFVQLREIDPMTKGGNLNICWTAQDKNLGQEPVNLYFRTSREGPWQVLAVNLANTGSFQWAFPRNLGAQFYIRVEVRDEAGNIARAETQRPVNIDLAEPKASVVGVTGINGNAP